MGHKVHPKIHRMQVIYTWDSHWFGRNAYAQFAEQDIRIREYLKKKFKDANIDGMSVERGPKNMTIAILAGKPGFIIGRGGKGLDDVRKHIERQFLQMKLKVKINVLELRSPGLSAAIAAQTFVSEIERRLPFRRVMKQGIDRIMKAGAQGVKIAMAGRLNGAEIARTEKLSSGKIPLITLRSDMDYAFEEAHTTYGKIGVKVWIYKGEVFGRKDKFAESGEDAAKSTGRRKRRVEEEV
ncbi:MAG: 30S ribosomal protein S3 [Candidatus Magasanikbacteria bacterium RIFCSPHIGHO2_02_FULL_51_14]|uniref:Small ribosomal subunit protein uS3 n=1 Tax=Candidatus Magasanikbacteria bacterium RIFCSPHIGHO2_02_FULL_51_14 TaxID=1798683 RepID=A0A1F6MHX1_9BACT|nr:MAG: 30S ribosomal protein S3 [Candidatus Magasanikbacteria bacterium RIFCSPHIGHO2_02_FULL_51_14]